MLKYALIQLYKLYLNIYLYMGQINQTTSTGYEIPEILSQPMVPLHHF